MFVAVVCVGVSGVGGVVGVVVECDSGRMVEEPRSAAYWKEERRPQILPSLPFCVSSSSGGASKWKGSVFVLVVVRRTWCGRASPVLCSCFLISGRVAGFVAL